METIQIVIDSKLRQAADRAAKRERIREMEERDRRTYEAHPQTDAEIALWENETARLEA
jgi:hypothetical protein